MKLVVYSTKQYDHKHLEQVNKKLGFGYDFEFFDFLLSPKTAKNAIGADAVCIFVNDNADREVLEELAEMNIKILALRCAGFNNVDLDAAKELGIQVVRVPAYSPEAVAEHTVGLMLCLNRRIHRAYQRTRDANFSLEGLIGFNMHNRTAGIIGTGKIGIATLRILNGFGMRLLAHDPYPNQAVLDLGVEYVDLDTLYAQSDVISLHCPLTPENHHLLNEVAFSKMKNGVMIINTSRGALIDSVAAINALKQQKIGALGMDVYENERDLFFEDKSNDVIQDDIFRRLSSCHNVLFTGHQAFLTEEALTSISEITLRNIQQLLNGEHCPNIVNKYL
ncbi:2-hydroxyacid dehydrogenase [Photorhabdus sp. P32]|uniref:2-hydroxyacid dehydrogenase n=1 Tax=Photorhabdus sp. P32 TaxID=3117549 RepID=UPI00311AF672